MKIVFVSNFMNHYQITISDELFKLSNGEYIFVETTKLPDSFKKNSGFVDYNRPYIIQAWRSEDNKVKAIKLATEADVVIGSDGKGNIPYIKERLLQNKLTYDCSERALKRGLINIFSPTNIITQFYYHLYFYNRPFYKLCASSYAPNDLYFMHSFKNKCYKYGYFPKIGMVNVNDILEKRKANKVVKIIWCARFIKWKHPELAVKLGKELKAMGYDFELNMIGKGKMWNDIHRLVQREGLRNNVHLLGSVSNQEVLKMMRDHDIFLFTSDRNEGWGVVLNEAMGQACCPVAADLIGATPSLLIHKKNGMIFKANDLTSLVNSVKFVIDNVEERERMSKSAYEYISSLWCPEVAASRLYKLIESHLNNNPILYSDGPLSMAIPI